MHTISGFVLLTAVTLAAACSQSDDHGLAAARARWAARGPAAYSFVWERGCECVTELTRPTEINVASGQIVGAVYVEDRSPVPDQFRPTLRTVDGVFDDIQAAIDDGAVQIDVAFDPATGYPTHVFVDYSRQIADEELSLQLSGLASTPVR